MQRMDTPSEVIESYPANAQKHVQALRSLIVETASELNLEIVETLKWGEPAFVTKTKSGSTVRLGWKAREPDVCAMYFICTTTLVEGFRAQFGEALRFEGNRAILLRFDEELPLGALKICIGQALTYHARAL